MIYKKDNKGRYVRIPRSIEKHSKINQTRSFLAQLIMMHKRSIEREKAKLRISEYGLLWITFFRGLIIALILERLLLH